jgi:hypothetical protein
VLDSLKLASSSEQKGNEYFSQNNRYLSLLKNDKEKIIPLNTLLKQAFPGPNIPSNTSFTSEQLSTISRSESAFSIESPTLQLSSRGNSVVDSIVTSSECSYFPGTTTTTTTNRKETSSFRFGVDVQSVHKEFVTLFDALSLFLTDWESSVKSNSSPSVDNSEVLHNNEGSTVSDERQDKSLSSGSQFVQLAGGSSLSPDFSSSSPPKITSVSPSLNDSHLGLHLSSEWLPHSISIPASLSETPKLSFTMSKVEIPSLSRSDSECSSLVGHLFHSNSLVLLKPHSNNEESFNKEEYIPLHLPFVLFSSFEKSTPGYIARMLSFLLKKTMDLSSLEYSRMIGIMMIVNGVVFSVKKDYHKKKNINLFFF